MRKRTVLLLVSSFFFTFISCSSSKLPVKTMLTFVSGKVTRNNQPVNCGDYIEAGDTISTSNRSLAVLQFDKDALILINSNTTIKIASLMSRTGEKAILIQQFKGNSFNKVVKKSLSYHIGTATMTAAVRGTSFSVYIDPVSNVSRLKIIEGKVVIRSGNYLGDMVSQIDSRPSQDQSSVQVQEVVLTQGFEIDGSPGGLSKPVQIDPGEIEQLNIYKSVSLVEMEKQNARREGMEKKDTAPAVHERELHNPVPEEIEQKLRKMDSCFDPFKIGENGFVNTETAVAAKLETIKRKNKGKLDVIKLSNGKELRGMIIERGPVYKVETPDGVRLIDRNDIVSQTIKF